MVRKDRCELRRVQARDEVGGQLSESFVGGEEDGDLFEGEPPE